MEDPYTPLRQMMVDLIASHTEATKELTGVARMSARTLSAMADVPRHEFVPAEIRAYAHADGPLPIGHDKTISQPFIAALMTELLEIDSSHAVLEIGTGLGYHTAVLARLAAHVYTVEYVAELAEQAAQRLNGPGCANISMRTGNGYNGWPDHAPYDRIMVAAAPELIPPALLQQLEPGGRMVIPAGLGEAQQLMVVDKDMDGKITSREILAVRFAAMEGAAF